MTKGAFMVKLGVNEVWTLTTSTAGNKGRFNSSVPLSKNFPLPYQDNFDSRLQYYFTTRANVHLLQANTMVTTMTCSMILNDRICFLVHLFKLVAWCSVVVGVSGVVLYTREAFL